MSQSLPGFVYIMGSMSGVLYVGSTSDLERRVWEHKEKLIPHSFTSKYNVSKLLYYEVFYELYLAREREAQLKNWSRRKKLVLIEKKNHLHLDLAHTWYDGLEWDSGIDQHFV